MNRGTPTPGPAEALRISYAADPDVTWVVLSGALDLGTLPIAEREAEAAERRIVEDATGERVALGIDLCGLDYIDSSGVRLVLVVNQRARDGGRRLAVRLGDGVARRVFDMLEITPHLDLVDGAARRRSPR